MHAVVLDGGVRDAAAVRKVIEAATTEGRVTTVQTGTELIAAMQQSPADLVLTPLEPPDMLFRRLRYHLDAVRWEGPLGVFTTADAEVEAALRAGADFALRRPMNAETLVRALYHFRLLDDPLRAIPNVEELEDTWSIALRRPFQLGFADRPIDLERPGAVWLADYRTPQGNIEALALFDETLGLGLGAAMTLLPPTITKEALRRRAASERLCRNLHRICEMLTELYDQDDLHLHSVQRTVHVPRAIRTRAHAHQRLDLEVDLNAYGKGRASFVRLQSDRAPRVIGPPPAPPIRRLGNARFL